MTIAQLTHTHPDGTTETVTVTDATQLTLTLDAPGVHTLTVNATGPGQVTLARHPQPVPLTPLPTPDAYALPTEYTGFISQLEWRDGDTITPLADQAGETVQPGEYAWGEDGISYVVPSLGAGGPWAMYVPSGGPR